MAKEYDPRMHSAEHALSGVLIRRYGCPRCKSFNVKKDDRWSNAGMTAGAVGGAATGYAGFSAGAAAGAAIGSVVPVLGTALGALTGGIIGALTGGAGGAVTGHKLGDAADRRYNKRLYRCRDCGKLFAY